MTAVFQGLAIMLVVWMRVPAGHVVFPNAVDPMELSNQLTLCLWLLGNWGASLTTEVFCRLASHGHNRHLQQADIVAVAVVAGLTISIVVPGQETKGRRKWLRITGGLQMVVYAQPSSACFLCTTIFCLLPMHMFGCFMLHLSCNCLSHTLTKM